MSHHKSHRHRSMAEIDPMKIQDINVLRRMFNETNAKLDDCSRENNALKRKYEEVSAQIDPDKKQKVVYPCGWSITGKWVLSTYKVKVALEREIAGTDKTLVDQIKALQHQLGFIKNVLEQSAQTVPEFKEHVDAGVAEFKENTQRKDAIARLDEEEYATYKKHTKDKNRKAWLAAWMKLNPTWPEFDLRPKASKKKKDEEPEIVAYSREQRAAMNGGIIDLDNDSGADLLPYPALQPPL